jgi:NAD+ diphosphatase
MSAWQAPNPVDFTVPSGWAQQWREGRARLLGVSGTGRVAIRQSADALTLDLVASTDVDYDPQAHLWLGTVDQVPIFAALGEPVRAVGLRDGLDRLSPVEAELAMRAAALAQYHSRQRFCPECGGLTGVDDLGRSRLCAGCGQAHFPRTDPAIIVAVADAQDRLLLGHHAGWPDHRYSVLAGFVEAGESLEQTVYREVMEEVGLAVDDIRYVSSQPWPMPRSLMLGFTARTAEVDLRPDGVEIVAALWVDRPGLRQAVRTGEVLLPTPVSIAYRLITTWYGAPLPTPATW